MSKVKSLRTLIKDTIEKIGEIVTVQGWVKTRRDHGKLIFLDVYDRSGVLQIIVNPQVAQEAHTAAQALKAQYVVAITGKVNKRSERNINKEIPTGEVELEATIVEVLSPSETLPFDMDVGNLELELPTLLDYRSLTLRHPKVKDIFTLQATIAQEFRNAATELGCTEIFIPTIASGATEGGSEVFTVNYYGHKAFMTQSPQLYKQIMVGVMERVFVITKAYRAEPSVTTRHLSEVTMMDIEIAFIESFEQLLDALEFVGTTMIQKTAQKHEVILKEFGVKQPLVPTNVPRLTLKDAQGIITKRTGRDLSKEMDLNPDDEIEICAWAKETHKSDFVTITHFPAKKRAFYTYPDPENPEYSLSYDLLFRGREILSGSRRISDYNQLVAAMKAKDVNPKIFGMYLMAFRYGMPPEGGFSFGLERLTMQLLGLKNIREASLFPRDMERVDERFSAQSREKNIVKENN